LQICCASFPWGSTDASLEAFSVYSSGDIGPAIS
jgi:hypothetical protein